MMVRIFFAGATEPDRRKLGQPEVSRV